jgi:hypothetical protein
VTANYFPILGVVPAPLHVVDAIPGIAAVSAAMLTRSDPQVPTG